MEIKPMSVQANRTMNFESLEDRKLMAASIELNGDTIEIEGTSGNDVIEIQSEYGYATSIIRVEVRDINGKILAEATYDDDLTYGYNSIFPDHEIQRIKLDAGRGDDYVVNNTSRRFYAHGGVGNDTLIGGSGIDFLYGESGNDNISGGRGRDYLYGGDGRDTISGGDDRDYLFGGTGNDLMSGDSGNDTLYGQTGNDTITGGSGNDYLNGADGTDRLQGDAGNDRMYGGNHNDTLSGGSGNDYLYGDAGNDQLFGESGDDNMFGGSGTDFFNGGSGHDRARDVSWFNERVQNAWIY
jgi:Ca2+-binding RTX toxin-like protein